MKKLLSAVSAVGFTLLLSVSAFATNGDNFEGIGPISRSMGGVGIAAPQDAISAVFSNPAAMCFGPYCPGTEFDFAGTLFAPKISTKIEVGGMSIKSDSDSKVFAVPAIGLSVPITNNFPMWRFGIAAYGVTGLGVDYRDTDMDNSGFYNFGSMGSFPLASGTYTQLMIMKFAPTVAYQPNEKLSFGLAAHIDYSTLDLGQGESFNYGLGAQLGTIYKFNDQLSVGATYTSPQSVKHKNVADLDGDGEYDDLKLESPQQFGVGVAFKPIPELLLEADVKWINWANADGYSDFDWENQWVFGLGAQYHVTKQMALRAGYNYGKNPVKEHDDFTGYDMISVQGKSMPKYYYETFRIVGFPAIVEHHVTLGLGYEFSNRFAVNFGYMHAFSENITEKGTNLSGQPVKLESKLSEDSLEFGLTWRF